MQRFFYAAAVALATSQAAFAEQPVTTGVPLPVVLIDQFEREPIVVDPASMWSHEQATDGIRALAKRAHRGQPILLSLLSKQPRVVVLEHSDPSREFREYISARCAIENVECEFFRVGADALHAPDALNVRKSAPARRAGGKK